MTEDGAAMLPADFVGGQEHAAHGWLHTENLKEIGGDEESAHPLWIVRAGQVHIPPPYGRGLLEGARLPLPVEEVRGRDVLLPPSRIVGRRFTHRGEPAELREGEWPENYRVDDG